VRGCVSVLVLAAAFTLGAAWFGGPRLAAALVQGGLAAGGFGGQRTTVDVVAEPPFEVLTGHADRVVIGSNDASFGELEVTRIDLVLGDVDLVARTFGSVDGALDGVRVGRVELSGTGSRTGAVVTMAGVDVEQLARDAINDALTLPVGGAELRAPDLLRLSVAGQAVDARLLVEPDGRLALAVPLAGETRLPIVDADPITLESVTVADGNLVLTGTLDLAALLGG
jgi:hypothetical protein